MELVLLAFSIPAADIYVYVNEFAEIKYACQNSGAESLTDLNFVISVVDKTTENSASPFRSGLLSCPRLRNESLGITANVSFECDREYSIFAYFVYANGSSLTTCHLSNTTYIPATCPPSTGTTEPSMSNLMEACSS